MNAPVRTPLIVTDDQYEDMARKGAFTRVGRVELRGGVIVAMSPIYFPHAHVKDALHLAIEASLRKQGEALRVNTDLAVRFGNAFQPNPDLVVWDFARAPANLDGPLPAACVRLIVEVADASYDDDTGQKLLDYAAGGLTEYWVADVKRRRILQHTVPNVQGYATCVTHKFGATVAALTAPLTVETGEL